MQERVSLVIDGRETTAHKGQTVLEAALSSGIYIPHLCTHPDLPVQGNCNLCIVEVGGADNIVKACETPVFSGMRVTTKSAALTRSRNVALELVLAGHPKDCTSCKVYLNCELQSLMQYMGVVSARMRPLQRETTNINVRNPLIVREMERCVQCGRCVRACRDLRGVDVLRYSKQGWESYIGTERDVPLADAGCRFCGACVEVCPTGALTDPEGVFRKDVPRAEALVPCAAECPAGIDVPRYTRYIREGDFGKAAAVIREKAPFPHTLGHICNRRCETACKRARLNGAVSIRELKRSAVENDAERSWYAGFAARPDSLTGKTVGIVGSGPCGLTAAYFLRKKGHEVTVYERLPVAGGMMAAGIPEYRLPAEIVADEIKAIEETGVKILTGSDVASATELKERHDAVLVAAGTWRGKRLAIPGSECAGVLTAVELLSAARLGLKTDLGARVNIIGGGNVAYDCARTLVRMGKSVSIVCLEKGEAMLADEEEIREGAEEGVALYDGYVSVGVESANGAVAGHRIISVESFHFDEERKLVISTVPGSEKVIPCDSIVMAAGQEPDLNAGFGLELNRFGYPVTGEDRVATSADGVFVAGDASTGTKFVVDAIGAGRKAAAAIDRYLGGDGETRCELIPYEPGAPVIGRVDGFAERPAAEVGLRSADARIGDSRPVCGALSGAQASSEAERCLQCDLRKQISKVSLWTHYA